MNTIKLAPLLLTFAEVAKERSFTGAAKKLAMSKSAISQQVKRLENELGTQLLARNTRGVVLTQTGESLLARSELLSEQLANAIQDINQHKNQPSGRFKISIPPFFERQIIVPVLKQLCLEFPLIQPEIVITGQWQDLIEHQLDAAIFGGDLKDSDYKAQSIGKVRDIFCASPHYLEQTGAPIEIKEIAQHKYIATPWQSKNINYVDKNLNISNKLKVTHYAHTNSLNTLVDMTLAGLGVSLIPEFIALPEISRGNLRQVLPNFTGREWHFYFLHRYKNNKPAHVIRFYQLVLHYFIGVHNNQ